MTTGQCPNNSISGYQFPTHYDCVNAGYAIAQKTYRNLSELEEWNIDYINKNNVGILYLGYRKHEEALNIFSKMQVGVAPSTNDIVRRVASPVKIFDYAACGLPIVTVNAGEWSNIIKEYDCGIVTDSSDPMEFADAIKQLNYKEVWEMKSKNAKRMIEEQCNWNIVLNPLLDIYMK